MNSSIDFYYDIVCPYAYLASLQIEEIADQCDLEINWKPVLLGGIYKTINSEQQPSTIWPASKQRWNQLDLQRQIEKIKADFVFHPNHPQRTVEVMRLLSVCPEESRPAMSKRLYQAYWVENIIFPNEHFLDQLALEYQLPINSYKSENSKQLLYQNTAEAVKKGLFGVPTIIYDEQFIWGQDRLFFLKAHYLGKKTNWPDEKTTETTIRFYHDFASPFSFLAAMVIDRLSVRYNATIEYIPILLGGLFKNIGTPIVPIATMSPAKQKYIAADLHRWAKWWDTEFNWPNQFPMRTVLPLRVSLILPESIKAIYEAYWIRGENISSPEILAPIIKQCGASPEEVFQRCQAPVIKEKLKENTRMAQENDVCGVPSFQIDDQLWWGQDRLDDIAEYLYSL